MSSRIFFENASNSTVPNTVQYGYVFGPQLDTFRGLKETRRADTSFMPRAVCRHLHRSPEAAIKCAHGLSG